MQRYWRCLLWNLIGILGHKIRNLHEEKNYTASTWVVFLRRLNPFPNKCAGRALIGTNFFGSSGRTLIILDPWFPCVSNENRRGVHLLEPPFRRLRGATLIWALRTQRAHTCIWGREYYIRIFNFSYFFCFKKRGLSSQMKPLGAWLYAKFHFSSSSTMALPAIDVSHTTLMLCIHDESFL